METIIQTLIDLLPMHLDVFTVVRMARKDLANGDFNSAVLRLISDADKFGREEEALVKFLRTHSKRAHDEIRMRDNVFEIEMLNETINDGRGSSVARSIVGFLKQNDRQSATVVWRVDSDKVRQYPEMFKLLTSILGEDTSTSTTTTNDDAASYAGHIVVKAI